MVSWIKICCNVTWKETLFALEKKNLFFSRTPYSYLQPPIEAAYLYDAVFQYAAALNRTLNNSDKVSDGEKITQNLLGHLFNSKCYLIADFLN